MWRTSIFKASSFKNTLSSASVSRLEQSVRTPSRARNTACATWPVSSESSKSRKKNAAGRLAPRAATEASRNAAATRRGTASSFLASFFCGRVVSAVKPDIESAAEKATSDASPSDRTETPASATRAKISVTSPNASASPPRASLSSSGSPATVRSASSAALRRHGAISRSRLDANEPRNSVRSAANGSTNASETFASAERRSVSVSFPGNSTLSRVVRASSSSSSSSASSASRGGDRNAKNDDLALGPPSALPAEAEVEAEKVFEAETEAEARRSTTFFSSRFFLGLAKRRNATAHFVAARPSATASAESRRRPDLAPSPCDTTVASENVFVTSVAHKCVLIASTPRSSPRSSLSKA